MAHIPVNRLRLQLWEGPFYEFGDVDGFLAAFREIVRTASTENVLEIQCHGCRVTLIVGSEVSFVQFDWSDGGGPYDVPVAAPDARGEHEFYPGGHHTPMELRYVFPIEAACQLVEEFILSGERPPSVSWGQF